MAVNNTFAQRLECPSIDNKWYRKDAGNPCLYGNASQARENSSVLPNCVGYAFGRFSEIMGTWANSCFNRNAGADMWNACKAVYETGQVPQLGAAIIWAPQHVGIVEQINSDGSIIVSESGWGASWLNRFWTSKCTKESGYIYTCNYITHTLGFVYNPAVTKDATLTNMSLDNTEHPANRFVREAESHAGVMGHSWVQSMTSIGNQAWCAATCCAVAKACGYAGVIMPERQYTASGFGKSIVEDYGGTYIAGPRMGDPNVIPQPGDIIEYTNDNGLGTYGRGTKYSAYHVGIVKEVVGDTLYTIEGNTGNGEYRVNNQNRKNSSIGWYARPDWTKVGGSTSFQGVLISGELYESQSTRADATIREVGFMNAQGQPSIRSTGLRLSVINYTGPLSQLVKNLAGTYSTFVYGSVDNIDGLEPKAREIVKYFIDKGLPTSAAIGILANIRGESGLRTEAYTIDSNGKPSGGLCQWNGARFTAMTNYVGADWRTDLTGQLDYLWYELSTGSGVTNGTQMLADMKNLPNTLDGSYQATEMFVRLFERPGDPSGATARRQVFAKEYWEQIIVGGGTTDFSYTPSENAQIYTPTSYTDNDAGYVDTSSDTTSGQTQIRNVSGTHITTGSYIKVPASVPQTGILATARIFDSDAKYTKTAVSVTGTDRTSMYNLWIQNGRKYSHGVPTISGYYLVAVSPKVANIGDMISIVFDNDDETYLNAIVFDHLTVDSTKWGILRYNIGYDMVSWFVVDKSWTNTSDIHLKSELKKLGFLGQTVGYFVNYGKFNQ